MGKKAPFVALVWIVVAITILFLYILREVSPVKDFIAWALSIWPILLALGTVAIFISGWIIRHDFSHHSIKELILTPNTSAIGLSGMTGFPDKPLNALWLGLGVSVNAIDKPIDTLDVIIDGKTIPANHWHGRNVAAFHVYFNVTEWQMKGERQVELIANKKQTWGRIPINFSREPSGMSHPI